MQTIVMAIDSMIPTGDDFAHWPTDYGNSNVGYGATSNNSIKYAKVFC